MNIKRFSVLSLSLTAGVILFVSTQALSEVYKTSRRLSGFSTDSRHYIYLESYRNSANDIPQAQIQIINTMTNSCVENGCLATENSELAPGLTTQTAEAELLKKTATMRYNLKLGRPAQGRRLSPLSRKTIPGNAELYTFQVNDPKKPLRILIQQKYTPSVAYGGDTDLDRAALRLEVTYDYRKRTLSTLNRTRESAMKYTLREVRLAPNGKYAVILFNVLRPAEEGALQGTMVQSFPL